MNLRKIFCGAAMAAAITLPGVAIAEPIWTMTRDYGEGAGQLDPRLAGTCDALNSDSVAIRNASGCQRFVDVFDFSDLLFDEIERFEVTMVFSETNNQGSGFLGALFNYEDWAMRPAMSLTQGSGSGQSLSRIGSTPTSQTFSVLSTTDIFDTVVGNQQFYLWMQHNGRGQQEFNLFSATLSIFGTATASEVSAPGSLALLGLGTALLGLRRRRTLH